MGLYDSFLVKNVKCPSCNKMIEELEIQFKLRYPRLETFNVGEYFVKEKVDPGRMHLSSLQGSFRHQSPLFGGKNSGIWSAQEVENKIAEEIEVFTRVAEYSIRER